jgi:hypothetical protein
MKAYDNPSCTTINDFRHDMTRITHLNRLFNRYYEKDDLQVRLILNHMIVMYNVFKPDMLTEMLFSKVKPEYWSGVKTILTYLSYMPEKVSSINKLDSDIAVDTNIAKELRQI